jgi:hypothetical protein
MAIGKANFTSKVTQESEVLTFWVVHFGDHNVAGGVQPVGSDGEYQDMLEEVGEAFALVDIPEVVRLLDKRFKGRTYSLRSLFRDEQRRILGTVLSTTVSEAEAAYLQVYEHHAALMRFINSLGTPMPREFAAAMEYALNSLLRRACAADHLDGDRIANLLREAQANNVSLDKTTLEFTLRRRIDQLASRFAADPSNIGKLQDLASTLRIVKKMPFFVNLWAAQNHVYAFQGGIYGRTSRRAENGDEKAQEWVDCYRTVSDLLSIRVQ